MLTRKSPTRPQSSVRQAIHLLRQEGQADPDRVSFALFIGKRRAIQVLNGLRRAGLVVPRPDPTFPERKLSDMAWGLRRPWERRCRTPITA